MPRYSGRTQPDMNEWLARLDMTAAQLSRALGISHDRISRWAAGQPMAMPTLVELALEKIEIDLQTGALKRTWLNIANKNQFLGKSTRQREKARMSKSITPPTTTNILPELSASTSWKLITSTSVTPSSTSGEQD